MVQILARSSDPEEEDYLLGQLHRRCRYRSKQITYHLFPLLLGSEKDGPRQIQSTPLALGQIEFSAPFQIAHQGFSQVLTQEQSQAIFSWKLAAREKLQQAPPRQLRRLSSPLTLPF